MATTTFLFTDIEGSTRLWETHPEGMEQALRIHDELVVDAVERHGGRVFKHTGDGFAAAFESARPAVDAAADIQGKLTTLTIEGADTLKVRIGIHSGEVIKRGEDYFGPTLNRVARLTAAGHGGQVLVSLVTERLLEGENIRLRDLGEHRLKDLGRPERLFQLEVDGLPGDFPALTTLDEAPNNLPTLTTSFVGRDQELAEVEKLVRGSRLVTITGVGGSGKTRMALQAAAHLVTEFPDGVWLVELGAVTDPELIDGALVDALGLGQPSGKTLREAAIDHLAARGVLLVIDNCEHLIGAVASQVEEILTHAPECSAIATSRELLGVPGEVAYGLRSMSLPDPDAELHLLPSYDSVRLFVERAAVARPEFHLSAENAEAVVEICRRLDGMPLAIELAAARLRTFSPGQIAELLDQRFRLLTGGSRTALPRQQTLTATIEWSYRLLEEKEKVLFQRLSVFQGGFTLEAVQAVCTGDPVDALDVLELLPHLVDKSLVVADEWNGEVRYRLLETLRQFARDRLDESGQGDEIRRGHAEYCRELVIEGSANFIGPDEELWHRRIDADMDNLRQAMTWALNAGEVATALILATGFARFSMIEDRWSEPLGWIEQALDGADDLTPAVWAEGLRWQGYLLSYAPGRDEDAVAILERATGVLRELDAGDADPGELYGLPRALMMLAVVLFRQGRAGESNEIFTELVQEALEVARRLDDQPAIAAALSNLAHHMDPRGDPEEARRLFIEAEEVRQSLGSKLAFGGMFSQRAFFEFEQRQYGDAHHYWTESVQRESSPHAASALESRAGIAACDVEMGDLSGADRFRKVVREAFDQPDVRESVRFHQTFLAFGAGIGAKLGNHARVALAAGASQAEDAQGTAVRWDLVEHFERAKAEAREALGEEEFAALVDRGRAMTHDDVTAFLLDHR